MEQVALPTAGLLMLKDKKLLLTYSRNKKAWYLPGGKVDRDETSKEALIREIEEELNVQLDPQLLSFCYHITAPAYGEERNIIMEQDCYTYPVMNNIQASNEIEAVKYFSVEEYLKEPAQVVGVIMAFDYLQKDGFI
jgi:8-oxo-dGTP pyrophosphatase MutT (NUDIX family)